MTQGIQKQARWKFWSLPIIEISPAARESSCRGLAARRKVEETRGIRRRDPQTNTGPGLAPHRPGRHLIAMLCGPYAPETPTTKALSPSIASVGTVWRARKPVEALPVRHSAPSLGDALHRLQDLNGVRLGCKQLTPIGRTRQHTFRGP